MVTGLLLRDVLVNGSGASHFAARCADETTGSLDYYLRAGGGLEWRGEIDFESRNEYLRATLAGYLFKIVESDALV
jgi:hypothetical protein